MTAEARVNTEKIIAFELTLESLTEEVRQKAEMLAASESALDLDSIRLVRQQQLLETACCSLLLEGR